MPEQGPAEVQGLELTMDRVQGPTGVLVQGPTGVLVQGPSAVLVEQQAPMPALGQG